LKKLVSIILILISLIIVGTIHVEPIKAQTQNAEPLFSKNLFNVDLLYAYVQSGARTAVAIVNFTKAPDATLSNYSGVTEVYTVHVFSEGNLVSRNEKIGGQIGKGIASGFDLMNLGMDGGFFASTNVGLETFTIDYRTTDYPILNEPISVSLIRLGWITTQGGKSEIHLSSQDQETVKFLELTKYKEGFLYNNLLNQETLPTVDLFHPLTSYSPTPTPTVPEFSWLVVIPLLIAVLSIALLLRHRKTNQIN